LLATLAVVSLGGAREDARDAKRQADTRTMQSAVELFINDNGAPPSATSTPAATTWTTLGTALTSYLAGSVPTPPSGGLATDCAVADADTWNGQSCYFYCYGAGGNAADYLLGATLEDDTASGISGDVDANAATYGATACFARNPSDATTADVTANAAPAATLCADDGTDNVFCLGT